MKISAENVIFEKHAVNKQRKLERISGLRALAETHEQLGQDFAYLRDLYKRIVSAERQLEAMR